MPRPAQSVVALAVTVTLGTAGCGAGGSLGAHELSTQSKALGSDAAEGALLAQDTISGKTTGIYTREQSSELSGSAAKIAASLHAATTTPALTPLRRRLAALGAQVSADLGRLGGASEAEQRALRRRLQVATDQSTKIGTALP